LAIIKEPSKQNFERIDKFATLLDSKFQIPGTKIKIGVDGIIGFFLSLTRFLVFNNFVSAITGVSAIFFDFSKKFVGGTGFF